MATRVARKKLVRRKVMSDHRKSARNSEWTFRRSGALKILKLSPLEEFDWLVHGVSTREGGTSRLEMRRNGRGHNPAVARSSQIRISPQAVGLQRYPASSSDGRTMRWCWQWWIWVFPPAFPRPPCAFDSCAGARSACRSRILAQPASRRQVFRPPAPMISRLTFLVK